MNSSIPNYPQSPHLKIPLHWGLGLPTYELGGEGNTNIQSITYKLEFSSVKAVPRPMFLLYSQTQESSRKPHPPSPKLHLHWPLSATSASVGKAPAFSPSCLPHELPVFTLEVQKRDHVHNQGSDLPHFASFWGNMLPSYSCTFLLSVLFISDLLSLVGQGQDSTLFSALAA